MGRVVERSLMTTLVLLHLPGKLLSRMFKCTCDGSFRCVRVVTGLARTQQETRRTW